MNYNPKIHHRRSTRLKEYDYSQAGMYFITLVTCNRIHLFGNIENDCMMLNGYGAIACKEWMNTEKIRKNMTLGEMIVMPNHVHGIIIINDAYASNTGEEMSNLNQKLQSASQAIGSVIRGYKSAVTKQINAIRQTTESVWQRNYYEHIIRDEQSYQRIFDYISTNPSRWKEDSLNQ